MRISSRSRKQTVKVNSLVNKLTIRDLEIA